jgi:3',5'-cyclic-nucleotide phosphodiesterase
MSERHTVRMRIGQHLPRHPGSHRPPAWWQRCGLILLVLLVTAVRGDGHTDVPAPGAASAQFVTIVLGAAGGLHEANLTAYLLAPIGERQFIALDAGTVLSGLQVATKMGSFANIQVPPASALTLEGLILREHIKAYVLSHAHLDHISGLILNAPDDSPKPILGLDATIDTLRDHVFNWRVWPNFGNEGRAPQLRQYTYQRLQPAQAYAIPGTSMTIQAFPLSHAGTPSTAFLIQAAGFYVLYCGDTGPDAVEHQDNLHTLWSVIAPLVHAKKLRAIFLEVSYPDERPDHLLFGHLTPRWLMEELGHLAQLVQPQHPHTALHGLTIVVTHIKPALTPGPSLQERITQQLQARNALGVRFIVPSQGSRLEF